MNHCWFFILSQQVKRQISACANLEYIKKVGKYRMFLIVGLFLGNFYYVWLHYSSLVQCNE